MNIKKTRLLGSSYVGLFAVTNDKVCLVPHTVEEKVAKLIEETLAVKVVKASIYESSLLAIFARMNNKQIFLPSYALPKEIEAIEKEVKVEVIQTGHALGNMMDVNDTHAVLSKSIPKKTVDMIAATGLKVLHMNVGKTETVGSALLLTNKAFLVTPNASRDEISALQNGLGLKGGSSSANTGDSLIRNSVVANSTGAIVGDLTTGFEMNRIDEALE